jgi:hypothetical protein
MTARKGTWQAIGLAFGLCLAAGAAYADVEAELSRLAWLEGRWLGTQRDTATEEIWSSPAGGALVGMHKDVARGRLTGFEFMRIAASDAGRVCFFGSPNGAPATPFCMVELGDRRVVFENKEHDFPQRILYWMDAENRLHARVEGTVAGKLESQEWVWTRQK